MMLLVPSGRAMVLWQWVAMGHQGFAGPALLPLRLSWH